MLQRPGILPAGAKKIPQSWFERLDAYLKAITGQSSAGVRVKIGPGGTSYTVLSNGTPPVTIPETPFQVVVGPNSNSDGSGEPQIGVTSDSHVMNSADKDVNEIDNSDWGDEGAGLLTDDRPADDPGWFVCPAIGSKIFLRFEFDADRNVKSICLEYGSVGDGDNWTQYPDPIEINTEDKDNPYQQYYHVLIAEITDPENDPRPGIQLSFSDGKQVQVTQILNTNLMLTPAVTTDDADQPNIPLMVAIPWMAPPTAKDGSADEINADDDSMTPWSFGEAIPDAPWHPYAINDETGTDDETPKVSVDGNSDFWGSFGAKSSITGLDEPFEVSAGELIYLVIEITGSDNLGPKSITVTHDQGWDEHPNPLTFDTDNNGQRYQSYYNQIIAEVVDVDDPREGKIVGNVKGKVKILEHLTSSLRATIREINGVLCHVPENCAA